jgi:putative ABC transport system permease protein
MIVLAPVLLLLVGIVALVLFDLTRRRNLRRMALRNIARRPLEAVMVVAGAALGTAIITAAFVAGDTFDASIRDIARTEFGPVDETVRVSDATQLDEVAAAIEAEPLPNTDGTLSLPWAQAAVRAGDQAEPVVDLSEVDFDAARAFGDDPAATGLADAGPTPSGDEAVVNQKLADDLDVATGDILEIFAYGQRREATVRTVAPRLGLAGYNEVYLAPGTIAELVARATPEDIAGAQPPIGEVVVSNTGGVFDGSTHTDAVTDALEDRVAGIPGIDVLETKQDLLDDAESSGAEMREMFSALGTFSIAVGVLLLVNLFVMLAEERKSELGMLRAVGMKRNHLVRLFGLEGALYSLVAAAVGALAGIGVGKVIVLVIEQILADEVAEDGLTFVFSVEPASLITGALVGLTISLLTVWGTSARIARLNVIRAIRELPDPPVRRASRLRLVFGALGMLLGGFILNAGVSGDSAIPVLIGPALALASAVPLFGRWLPRRIVIAVAGGLAAVWSVVALEVVPDAFDDAGIEMFVVQGLVLVGAAVAVLAQGDRVWAWIADRLADRGGLASRLAVAYPLARRVRTAMLLAMFALITFMLTFMSALSDAFLAEAPAIAEDQSAGWDMWVDSSPTNPIDAQALEDVDGVARAATLVVGFADLSNAADDDTDPDQWPVTGIDRTMIGPGVLTLSERLDGYSDDRAAFEAVVADPTLAIGPEWLLEGDEGPTPSAGVQLGDQIIATNPTTGDEQTLTLVGIIDEDWSDNGLLVGRDTATSLLGDLAVENRHLVQVTDGADAEAVVDRLEAEWITNGAEATTFLGMVEDELRETQGFIRLLQAYIGLGLIIGVAGLGVVMVRAVRERRQQIGMLRALGFSAQVVRRAFLCEAGFIALQGIVLGIGLGLVTSYQMLRSDAFDEPLAFTVPWLALVVLFVTPAAGALFTAAAPAAQAARIQPAAALRIAE